MDIQLITGSTQLQMPAVVGDIKWTLQRRGTAGQLTFTVVQARKPSKRLTAYGLLTSPPEP